MSIAEIDCVGNLRSRSWLDMNGNRLQKLLFIVAKNARQDAIYKASHFLSFEFPMLVNFFQTYFRFFDILDCMHGSCYSMRKNIMAMSMDHAWSSHVPCMEAHGLSTRLMKYSIKEPFDSF